MTSVAERVGNKVASRLEPRAGHICVIAFWALVAVCGVVFGPDLLKHVSMDFEPPSGSKSKTSTQALEKAFPGQAKVAMNVLYVEAPADGPSLLEPLVPGGSQANSSLCEITAYAQQYLGPSGPKGGSQLQVSGVCTLGPGLSMVAKPLLAKKDRASIIQINGPKGSTSDSKSGNAIIDLVKELRASYPSLFIGHFGEQTLVVEAMDGLSQDLERMDFTIPIAFGIMAIMVRSLRLIVLPLLCLAVSFVSSLLMVYLVNRAGMPINSAAPTLMMSILTALSIDYALFLLTRLQEEILGGAEMKASVAVMLARSGKTIVGSGLTLCLCFVGLLAFPIVILQSVGVAIVAAVLVTMAVNLTLMPACLMAFPRFFSGGSSFCCARQVQPDVEAPQETACGVAGGAEPLAPQAPLRDPEAATPRLPMWYRLAHVATARWSWLVAIPVLLAVLGPCSAMLADMKHSGSALLMVPRTSDSQETLQRMEQAFPAGVDAPYQLLLEPKVGDSVYTNEFFNESRRLITRVAEAAGDSAVITSPMWASGSLGNNLSYSTLSPMLRAPSDFVCELLILESLKSQCRALRYVANATVNADSSAVMALVVINHPLGSPGASDFTKAARDILDDFSASAVYVEAQLAGSGAVYADNVDVVYGMLPIVLGITLVVVLSIVGLLYRSVGIGLRALLTIAFTIAFSFGVAIGIYQYGWLDGLGSSRFASSGAFSWLVPPVGFSVILGLALDYDIFLVGRVVEFRLDGFGNRAAVELGLWKTGKVITAAGLIMAVSFGGLLLSDTAMLNQSGCMLVSAVLVDTFIVRSLIVPAVMNLMGRVNWWPRKVPVGYRDAEDYVRGQMLAQSQNRAECSAQVAEAREEVIAASLARASTA